VDLSKECTWLKYPQTGGLVSKASSIGARGACKIQNVVVPAHEVARTRGDREIDVRLVLGIPVEMEDARHFRGEHGSLLEFRKKSTDSLVRQCRNFRCTRGRASTSRTSAKISWDTHSSITSDSTRRRHAPAALSRLAVP